MVSSTDTGDSNVVHKMPRPSSPARRKLPGVETVCHIGGCGCCTGLGTTVRAGMLSRSDSHANSGSVHAFTINRAASSSSTSVPSPSMPNVVHSAPPDAREPELDPAVREVVEHRGALGDAQRDG